MAVSAPVRGDTMLQLFNVNWNALIQKMPEIAEAGYTSLWLPPPAKAGSVFSVGYDLFDPFDLGDKNQRGTVPTLYGTKAQLLQVVQVAHRFGIRVYFDNISNHRGFDIPGYNAASPTNTYPGMLPQDFHLQTIAGGYYRNWPNIGNFNNQWEEQYQPLSGLLDIANEPGSVNGNFGATLGSTITKYSFVRHPANPEYYMVPTGVSLGGPWHPFGGSNGVPVTEDVGAYLIRAAMWTLNETKCDGFRLDAVKHVPSGFFGDATPTFNGYTGGIQAMFDYVHGYGNNVTGNGYVEADDSRNSCYDTEAPRNDALIFGEHLGEPPTFGEYLARGMRLLNSPYHTQLNSILGNPSATLSGLDQRDYIPSTDAYGGAQSVMFAQSADDDICNHRELQLAYFFMREGVPEIYSDGYNQSAASAGQTPFPRHANAPYLGEFGDPKMPDLAYLHQQLARGGTRSRWSDNDIVAFERYDYREGSSAAPQDQSVVLFAMNDNYGNPGDISFDDGVAHTTDGTYYECFPVENSRGLGLVTGFPPGTMLVQLATGPGADRACHQLLVRLATPSLAEAQTTANDPNPVNRKVYVGGQSLAPGGGAIEFKIPSGGYVMYGLQWPEASRASLKDAITLQQGGSDAPRMTVLRQDGVNGDAGFNPLYPFKMRGSIDKSGQVITGANISNLTYAIDVPVVTNAVFNIVLRNDASSVNTLVKLDGGLDINSQMALGPTGAGDLRDNRPGYATDVFLGYEQTLFQFRNGPEKFAARNILSNNLVSTGAETYLYIVGGASSSSPGAGTGAAITNQTATWVYHDPTNGVTALGTVPATQRFPANPTAGQAVDLWVKVGYQSLINTGFIYYTTDGSQPLGSFGVGKGSTKVVPAYFANHDGANPAIDWWKGTLPAISQTAGASIRYQVAFFATGINPISDAEASGSKRYGLTQTAITNFNPAGARVWLHNDLNPGLTVTGLEEGFHIVRARTFLPRTGKASVYNTFLQTFYYDAQLPNGAIAFPTADGASLTNGTYTLVIRADAATTGVECNITDSNAGNDDAVTGQNNGNGLTNSLPVYAPATLVAPDPTLDAQYPTLPQEFRFTYGSIPSQGAATISVRLKKRTTAIYRNRFTALTRTVNTSAPSQIVKILVPATNGTVLNLTSNQTYTTQACFSQSLTATNIDYFSVTLNGVLQPRRNGGTPLYQIFSASPCGTGFHTLYATTAGWVAGTNTLTVTFTNGTQVSDTRLVNVQFPLDPRLDSDGDGVPDWQELLAGTEPHDPLSYFHITGFEHDNRLLVWSSVPGKNYQVMATTNLNSPFLPISNLIPGTGTSTFYSATGNPATNSYYRVLLVQ